MHYKTNKRRRSRRRSGGRGRGRGRISRRMRMKGGLGPNDSVNINLPNKYVFADEGHKRALEMFTFGSPAQHEAWLGLLTACRTKGIPFYILTNGDKVGIIRTLQLLGMDDYVTEVLCTHQATDKLGRIIIRPDVNPSNTVEHNFQGQNKYAVIQQILKENGLECQSSKIGYLMDDNLAANNDHDGMCPSIVFEHVLSPGHLPTDIPDLPTLQATLEQNPIYKLNVSKLGLAPIESARAKYNFTPIDKITRITEEVTSGGVTILFVDFDQTFQIWEGAIPLGYKTIIPSYFDKVDIKINVI